MPKALDTAAIQYLEGAGFKDWIKNPIGHFKEALKGKRKDYSPAQRDLLAQIGNIPIRAITIFRQPLSGLLNTIANHLTFGLWDRARKKHQLSEFFHLGLVCVLENNTFLVLEKTQVVQVSQNWSADQYTQTQPVPMDGANPTVQQFLDNTRARMGDSFWTYDAFKNNCQTFVLSMLRANGFDSPEMHSFVYQDVGRLLEDIPGYVGELTNKVTDLANHVDIAINGRGRPKRSKK